MPSRVPAARLPAACAVVAAECACEGLRRASRAVTRLYEGALAGFGLTATQFAILVGTRLRGPVPLSRLAHGLVLDRTSLYRALRPLQRRGYLEIAPGRTQRERTASLTAHGEDLLRRALPVWSATQERFVGMLGARAWASLASAMAQVAPIVRAIEAGAGAAPTRPPRPTSTGGRRSTRHAPAPAAARPGARRP
jgi:DNA-binding MarR family transcriptional regulator